MLITTAIAEIRRGLGRPNEAELSDSDILLELWQVITYYRSLLKVTFEAWEVKRYDFDVTTGTPTELNFSITDFGSSIFVTSRDTTNPYFIQRTINVVGPEQMSLYFSGPTNLQYGGSWWSPHVAQVFSIIRESNTWKLLWLPAHQEAASYTMWYTPGAAIIPPLLSDSTQFPIEESNWLIIANCILNLFPHLADPKLGLNLKQQALYKIAEQKMQQYSPILEAERWNGPHRETTQRRKIFGQRRSNI